MEIFLKPYLPPTSTGEQADALGAHHVQQPKQRGSLPYHDATHPGPHKETYSRWIESSWLVLGFAHLPTSDRRGVNSNLMKGISSADA